MWAARPSQPGAPSWGHAGLVATAASWVALGWPPGVGWREPAAPWSTGHWGLAARHSACSCRHLSVPRSLPSSADAPGRLFAVRCATCSCLPGPGPGMRAGRDGQCQLPASGRASACSLPAGAGCRAALALGGCAGAGVTAATHDARRHPKSSGHHNMQQGALPPAPHSTLARRRVGAWLRDLSCS